MKTLALNRLALIAPALAKEIQRARPQMLPSALIDADTLERVTGRTPTDETMRQALLRQMRGAAADAERSALQMLVNKVDQGTAAIIESMTPPPVVQRPVLDWSRGAKVDLTLETNASVWDVTVSAAGHIVGVKSDHAQVDIRNQAGQEIATFPVQRNYVNAIATMPSGEIITGLETGECKIWEPTGRCIARLNGHTGMISEIVVLPDGRIVTASYDHTAKVWDLAGDCLATLSGHTGSITSVTVLGNGRIVSASCDHSAKIWDANGTCLATLVGHTSHLLSVLAFADESIVTSAVDGTLKFWDKAGSNTQTLQLKQSMARHMVILPGVGFMTANEANANIWDADGKCISTLSSHIADVTGLAVLPDGRIVTGSTDRSIKIWSPITEAQS